MARAPLSQLDDWKLVDRDQDLRGMRLVDEAGNPIGTVREMIVNTDTELVEWLVLDNGQEIPTSEIRIEDNAVYLLGTTYAEPVETVEPVETAALREAADEVVVPIVEEDARVGKRVVERGGIRVTRRVEEVPVNEQVTLRDERVTVERRPVDRSVDAGTVTDAFREGTFEVRAYAEEVAIGKQLFVVEEIHINKQLVEHTETVQETVRRTRVDIEEFPDRNSAADSGRTHMT